MGMYLLYLCIVVRIDVSPDLLCALVLVTRSATLFLNEKGLCVKKCRP
jgi:hypothetical protein